MRIFRYAVLTYVISTTLWAGGTLLAVSETTDVTSHDKSLFDNFYVGVGFGRTALDNDTTGEAFKATEATLIAGLELWRYLAIEARYMHHIGNLKYSHGHDRHINGGEDISDYPGDMRHIGFYFRPRYRYKVLEAYGLAGYGYTEITNVPVDDADRGESAFAWGVGVAYIATEHLTLFGEYVRLYDGTGFDYVGVGSDIAVDVWNIGVSYRF